MQPQSPPLVDPGRKLRYPRRMSGKDEQSGEEARAERLREALRENLKRRKAQARARRDLGERPRGAKNGAETKDNNSE